MHSQPIPKPTHDRVILQPLPPPEQEGRIFIPQTGRKETHRGRVLAVGSGRLTDKGHVIPNDFSVGDEVLYAEYNNAQAVSREKDGPVVLLIADVIAVVG